jgi:hypothetical protein
MTRLPKDVRELVEEEFSILGRLLLVPAPLVVLALILGRLLLVPAPLVVLALIEGGVNRGPPRPVALDQPTAMRDQDTSPDAHPWIWTQRTVRDLQHDREHVLVDEEVFARLPEIVRSAYRVGEEWVTAESGEKPEVTGCGDSWLGAEGDLGMVKNRLPGVDVGGGV